MQPFRPLSSRPNDVGVADAELPTTGNLPEEKSAPQPVLTGPLYFLTSATRERRTDELGTVSGMSGQLPQEAGTLSLLAALQSTMTVETSERVVVIPGSRQRARKSATPYQPSARWRRVSLRLRHGLVLAFVFFMLVTTLLSLSPLAAEQGNFHVFDAFGNWVNQQTMTWAIQSHLAPTPAQQPTTQNTSSNLPPMSLPTSQYIAIARQDAINAGISPDYFVRQINQESGFNPYAMSPAGAEGIAQFEPGTAAGLGIDPWNPVQALNAAAQMMARYNHNYGGNYAMALAAYNGGPGTVTYAVNACGAANWLNCLPGETRHYIYVIMGI
jgi:soluble lytic murein transglycosylase-like protein